MALTATQKATVRTYLGFSDISGTQVSSRLESAFLSLSAEGETLIVGLLTQLASVETILSQSWTRQAAIRAEEVTLAGLGEITALRTEGDRLVHRLASILGVQPLSSPFSGGAFSGRAGRG